MSNGISTILSEFSTVVYRTKPLKGDGSCRLRSSIFLNSLRSLVNKSVGSRNEISQFIDL